MRVQVTDRSRDCLYKESLCCLLYVVPVKGLHMVFSNEGLAKTDATLECEVVGGQVVWEDVAVEMRRGL